MIDLEIIEKCRKGDLRNFRKMIEMTSPFAFSVAFRMLGDEEQAKDIVQDTMITIWEKLGEIKSSERFKAWLFRIVVNKCYDRIRKRKRQPEIRADASGWALISNHISEEQPASLENNETARIINLLTDRLSPGQKTVFVLCDLEEMTQEEVAGITGMSRMNVKANLHYARKKMGNMIKKYL